MAHRRVGDHSLEIHLSQTHHGTIDEADHAEDEEDRLEFNDLVWEESYTQP